MVTAPEFAPPCSTGIGNSPPTRKLASLPLLVIRVGSSKVCSRFFCSRASMNAPRFKSGRKAKMFSALVMLKGDVSPAPTLDGGVLDEYWPVDTPPMVLVAPVEIKLTANELAADRSSSANLMRNRICLSTGGSATWRLFTTVFAKGVASAVARSPASFVATLPVRESESRED